MSEGVLSSSPTKSLSSWWRSFKSGGHEGDEAGGQLVPPRPGLGRSPASSSAVPGVSPRRAAQQMQASHGIAIPPQYIESPIFGVPLTVSLPYANVKISLADRDGESFVYGHVPVIIAKCAAYLKQNARETEGIFRIPGSVRRIRMLQDLFNTPPTFGKDLDWTGFSVHDAANLLKRYLAALPDPIIPRNKYAAFREPLQTKFIEIRDYMNYYSVTSTQGSTAQTATAHPTQPTQTSTAQPAVPSTAPSTQGPAQGDAAPARPSDACIDEAVTAYENLIFALPKSSMQLLLYLIDLLAVFAAESEANRMTAYNLGAIFQPSVLTIKEHDMNPEESQVSRIVIEFLIKNSGAILQRVQDKAIAAHEAQKVNGSSNIEVGITDYTPLDDTPAVPQFAISAPQDSASQDSPSLASQAAGSGLYVPSHARRHSKSLSSANPPSLQLQDSQMPVPKLGFLRRQRSTRSTRSNRSSFIHGHTDDVALPDTGGDGALDESAVPNRQSTLSPTSEEDEGERKSRFRRSLMILLPGKDSSLGASQGSSRMGSRSGSPSRPDMKRSPSWFAKLSGDTSSPDS